MPKTVVLYRSISGFTQRYAEWIAEELEANLVDIRRFSAGKFPEYDVIVFGGSLHAVGINGIKIIKENLSTLADKKIVVFAVGASPPKQNVEEEIKKANFSAEMQKSIILFYLRGGFDYNKLYRSNKISMTLYKARLSAKKNKTVDEKEMLDVYSKPVDFTKKENIEDIIGYIKSFDKPQ